MGYEVEPFQGEGLEPSVADYLDQQFKAISIAFGGVENILLEELHAEPGKPRNGQIVLADGTDWNPGAGAGYYGRANSSWYFMATGLFTPTVFSDYLVNGLSLAKGASAPDLATFRGNVLANAFAGTGGTTEQAYFSIHILHDIKQGSTPTFHIHWAHIIGSPTGNVKWGVEYTVARGYGKDTFPAPEILTTVQAVGTQYQHLLTDDDDMPLTLTLEPDAVILGRVFRDPTDVEDTFTNDAFLLNVDLHYEVSQIGSTERNRPFTSVGFPT